MKDLIFEPSNKKDEVIIQFTDTFILDKSMKVSVPNQYIAIVFDNEKIGFRIEPCVGKVIYKEYGKEYLGHSMKIAFIHVKALPEIVWGFGNIQVNNDRLKEAYRVGTNGTMQIQISDYSKLVNSFSQNNEVTIEVLKGKVLSLIKMIGTDILGKCFSNTDVSVFEISSLLNKIRDEMQENLLNEEKIKNMGIKINSLTVNGIHVNEEDLELIRDRINNTTYSQQPSNDKEQKKTIDIEAEFEKLSKKLSERVSTEIEESTRRTEENNRQQIAEELQKSQKEMLDSLMGKITDQLDEFGKSISSELDEKIQEMLPLQDKAKDDFVKEIKLTAENIITNAKDDEELIPAAAMIYSNVESNLVSKFGLKHENEKFIIDYKEYLDIVEKAKIGERYLLKRRNNDGSFSVIEPRVVRCDRNGDPLIVEMMPIVRFMKAGLSVEDTKKATEMWTVLNKIRHKSKENEKVLKETFSRANTTRKEYLLNTLNFYKKLGLYTKD